MSIYLTLIFYGALFIGIISESHRNRKNEIESNTDYFKAILDQHKKK
jgi:hypothetical protein